MANLISQMALADPGIRYRFIDTRGSRHIALSPLYFVAAIAKLAWLAACGEVDLIHANVSARGSTLRKLQVAALARALRLPLIVHLHDGRFDQFYSELPAFGRRAVRRMFTSAARVVVLSESWQSFAVQHLGVVPARIEIVCNGVPRPSSLARPQYAGPLRLLFLGRLWEAKGVADLLEALARPGVAALSWQATLAGDGDPAPYQRQADALGLADRIAFPGWQDRSGVDRLLDQADVLVLPSHVEGLPMVVLEALARRVPVVATRVGSIPEYLVHGQSAMLVKPRDVDGLSEALLAVIQSPQLRAALAAQGEAVFRRHFDIATTAKAVASLYRSVTNSNPSYTPNRAASE